jgi:hypothetical protein
MLGPGSNGLGFIDDDAMLEAYSDYEPDAEAVPVPFYTPIPKHRRNDNEFYEGEDPFKPVLEDIMEERKEWEMINTARDREEDMIMRTQELEMDLQELRYQAKSEAERKARMTPEAPR